MILLLPTCTKMICISVNMMITMCEELNNRQKVLEKATFCNVYEIFKN